MGNWNSAYCNELQNAHQLIISSWLLDGIFRLKLCRGCQFCSCRLAASWWIWSRAVSIVPQACCYISWGASLCCGQGCKYICIYIFFFQVSCTFVKSLAPYWTYDWLNYLNCAWIGPILDFFGVWWILKVAFGPWLSSNTFLGSLRLINKQRIYTI